MWTLSAIFWATENPLNDRNGQQWPHLRHISYNKRKTLPDRQKCEMQVDPFTKQSKSLFERTAAVQMHFD